MSYKIPRIHQRYSPLDVVRYALSVGLGQDPCDLWQLEFVDDQKGPRVLPSFCAVLGHPGFWLADPATTVDARRLVHAEQGIRLLAPLPPEGEIVSETRIVDVVDKGPDKGALLYLEKDLRDAKTHTLVATETRTVMLRGDGGYSGPSGRIRPTLSQPEGPADADTIILTRPEQALLYRLNGDPNPLHTDPSIARDAGFPQPILHGLCTFGIACQALLRKYENDQSGEFKEMSARFSAPVFPGDTISVDMWNSGTFRARAVERNQTVLSHGQVVFG